MPAIPRAPYVSFENPFGNGSFSVPDIATHFSRLATSINRGWNENVSAPLNRFFSSTTFFSRKVRPWFAAYSNYTQRMAKDITYGTRKPAHCVVGLDPNQAATLESYLRRYIALHNQYLTHSDELDNVDTQITPYTAKIEELAATKVDNFARNPEEDDLVYLSRIIDFCDNNVRADDGDQPGDLFWDAKNEALDLYYELNTLLKTKAGIDTAIENFNKSKAEYRQIITDISDPVAAAKKIVDPIINNENLIEDFEEQLTQIYDGGLQYHEVTYLTCFAITSGITIGILAGVGLAIVTWPLPVLILAAGLVGSSLAYIGLKNIGSSLWSGGFGKIVKDGEAAEDADNVTNYLGWLGLIAGSALVAAVVGTICFPVIGTLTAAIAGGLIGLIAGFGAKNMLRALKALLWTGPIDGLNIMWKVGFDYNQANLAELGTVIKNTSLWAVPLGTVFGFIAGAIGFVVRFIITLATHIKQGLLSLGATLKYFGENFIIAPLSWLANLIVNTIKQICSGIYIGCTEFFNTGFNPRELSLFGTIASSFKDENNEFSRYHILSGVFACVTGLAAYPLGLVTRGFYDFIRGFLRSIEPWATEAWDYNAAKQLALTPVNQDNPQGEVQLTGFKSSNLLQRFWSKNNKTHPFAVLGMGISWLVVTPIVAAFSGMFYGSVCGVVTGFHPFTQKTWADSWAEFSNNHFVSWPFALATATICFGIGVAVRTVHELYLGITKSALIWAKEGWDINNPAAVSSDQLEAAFLVGGNYLALGIMYVPMYLVKITAAVISGIVYGTNTWWRMGFNYRGDVQNGDNQVSVFDAAWRALTNNSYLSIIPAIVVGLGALAIGFIARCTIDVIIGFFEGGWLWLKKGWNYGDSFKQDTLEAYSTLKLKEYLTHENIFKREYFKALGMIISSPLLIPAAICKGVYYGLVEGCKIGYCLDQETFNNANNMEKANHPLANFAAIFPMIGGIVLGGSVRLVLELVSGTISGFANMCAFGFSPLSHSLQSIRDSFKHLNLISGAAAVVGGIAGGLVGIACRIVYDLIRSVFRSIGPWLLAGWENKYHPLVTELFANFWKAADEDTPRKMYPFALVGMAATSVLYLASSLISGAIYGFSNLFMLGFMMKFDNVINCFTEFGKHNYLSYISAVPLGCAGLLFGLTCSFTNYLISGLFKGAIYGVSSLFMLGFLVRNEPTWANVQQQFSNNSYASYLTAGTFGAAALAVGLIARAVYDFARGFVRSFAAWWQQGWNYTGALQGVEGGSPLTPYQVLKQEFWRENNRHWLAMIGMWCASPVILISGSISGLIYGAKASFKIGFALFTAKPYQDFGTELTKNSYASWPVALIIAAPIAIVTGLCSRVICNILLGFYDGFETIANSKLKTEGNDGFATRWSKHKTDGNYLALLAMPLIAPLGLIGRYLGNYFAALEKNPLQTVVYTIIFPLWGTLNIAWKLFTWTIAPIFVQPYKLYQDYKDFGSWASVPNKTRRIFMALPVLGILGKLFSNLAKAWLKSIPQAANENRHWFKLWIDSAAKFCAPPKYDKARSIAALTNKFGIFAAQQNIAREAVVKLNDQQLAEINDLLLDTLLDFHNGKATFITSLQGFKLTTDLSNTTNLDSLRMLKYIYNLFRSGHFNYADQTKHSQWRDLKDWKFGLFTRAVPNLESERLPSKITLGNYCFEYTHEQDTLTIKAKAPGDMHQPPANEGEFAGENEGENPNPEGVFLQ